MAVGSQQVLHKIKWINLQNGGAVRAYEFEEQGHNLVRLVAPEEVKPNVKYYMKDELKPNHFNETMFHPEVSWDTILEFTSLKKIYIRDEKPNPTSTSQPPANRDTGLVQSSLF